MIAVSAKRVSSAEPSWLSPDEQQFFEINGFLTLDQMTGAADVWLIRQELEALFARQAGYNEGALYDMAGDETDPDNPRLPQLAGPERYAPILRQTDFYRNAKRIAQEVLGPNVRLTQSHCIVKPPGSQSITPWHQDEAFGDPARTYNEINFWLALQPVNTENGCMRYIPGSHLGPVVPHVPADGKGNVHALDCSVAIDPSLAVDCPLPAGGCVLHKTRTVHGAGANMTDQPRWAYVLVFGLPPTPNDTGRQFPWQSERFSPRDQRRRAWLWRGGIFIAAWRKLRNRLFG